MRTIVKTMKALSAASSRQYEQAVSALGGYYRTIERGLHVVLKDMQQLPPSPRHVANPKRSAAIVFGSDHGLCGRFNEEREIRNAMRDLADHLYRSCRLTLLRSTALGTFSQPGEDRRDFILRLTQSAREARDQEIDQLRQKYDRRLDQMMDRLRRAETALAKKEADAQARKRELLTSVGESVLGMFLGRRSLRAASSSLGKYRMQTASDLARKEAEEKVEDLQGDVNELKRELQEQADVTARRWEEAAQALEEVTVTPRRTDVSVDRVSIGWIPCWVFPMEAAPGHPGDLVEVPAMTPLR
ncbi:MAG: F0F1 ATP synthase subunit gamma [Acidobacteriota bacterium]